MSKKVLFKNADAFYLKKKVCYYLEKLRLQLPRLLLLCTLAFSSTAFSQSYTPPTDKSMYDIATSDYMIIEGNHVVRSKAPMGELLCLEDGSLFSVELSSKPIVENWDLNAPVKLSCRISHLFSSYNLYLTDVTDSKVYAYIKLIKAPEKNSTLVSHLFHSDSESGLIYIRDSQQHETLWQIESDEQLQTLNSWHHGDRVVLGSNDSWMHYMAGADGFFLINYEHLLKKLPTAYLPVSHARGEYE
ncbi:hypothetical protein COB21_03840 [Candidatus Aerophobetes bacterium]|uniref:Uncharacterized protein n=1 Tax=Aerophobetes bacterium TaxID=2030807 RepID=A0A2A4X2P0_UNCAE|nr:MAG: hypothetical protein COB21_03840 [Candidatus Aerophobetes bacterium]